VRAPATRDQVDAYRYGLRRLEAALVRGDPVPLHEQIRTQRRAALAGVVLGMLGLCGAAALAALFPEPDWRRQDVVVTGSGAMYVVAREPDRLVPVVDLVAARLVLAALRAGGATDADPATATPVTVPDGALDAAPRTPAAAVPGAVAVRPDAPPVAARWALCDEVTPDGALRVTTTITGAAPLPPGPPGEGVLLTGPDEATWLVTDGRRHRVDTGDGRLLAALGLTGRLPRAAAPDLLALLPEGPELSTPAVARRGARSQGGLPDRVGDVLVARPVGAAPRYYVVLNGGLQEVPAVLAELLRVASGAREPREVGAGELATVRLVEELPAAGWPAAAPQVREPAEAPVVCWAWSAEGGPAGEARVLPRLPLPTERALVALAQADGPGPRVDAVAVGSGGTVRAAPDGRAPSAGDPLWLLAATGVRHRVADDATAAALGLGAASPAPDAALRLLPAGPTLDLAVAIRAVDALAPAR
jgi:type VII secretion protein EccB